MKCRDAKRNRNRYATGKGRSDQMELEAMGRIGTSVYGMVADPLVGYSPRPRAPRWWGFLKYFDFSLVFISRYVDFLADI
jgi:hypothetical protein